MQQIISKGCVIIKDVFSDLFLNLEMLLISKRNPSKKKGNSWGVGGPQKTLWKGNSKGVGVKTKVPSVGGMDIFWNHTLFI